MAQLFQSVCFENVSINIASFHNTEGLRGFVRSLFKPFCEAQVIVYENKPSTFSVEGSSLIYIPVDIFFRIKGMVYMDRFTISTQSWEFRNFSR